MTPSGSIRYPRLPAEGDDSVTRALCIAVHLNEDLRAEILRETLPVGLAAAAPSPGIDLVAVWRHAVEADERWTRAAGRLDGVRAALVSAFLVAVAGIALGIGAGTFGWAALGVLAAIVVTAGALAYGRSVLLDVVRASVEKSRALLWEDTKPRDEQMPLTQDERRVDAIQQANLIVFSRRSPSPFIGSGLPVEHVVMVPVNVGRAASTGASSAQPFTAVDVHRHLQEDLPEHAPDMARPEHRLFVRGDVIAVPGMTPWVDRDQPPPTTVDQQWIEAGIGGATGQARTYLCLQRAFNGGWLVVSMFVRVSLHGKMLSLETATYLLPGISGRYIASDDAFADHFDHQCDPRSGTIESACRAVTAQLFQTYLAQGRWRSTSDNSEAREEKDEVRSDDSVEAERRGAVGERVHDFGAETGLRERLSRSAAVDHFEVLDARDFLQRAHRAVIDSLGAFLVAHDVDDSEFRVRREQIINNTTFEIQSVQGTGHHIGNQGQITNTTTQEAKSDGDSGRQR